MKKLPATFFQSASGATPSLDWIRSRSKAEQKAIGTDIAVVEFGWPIGMPTCRAMGKGLYEIRTDLPSGRIARVFFYIHLHSPGPDSPSARHHQEDTANSSGGPGASESLAARG